MTQEASFPTRPSPTTFGPSKTDRTPPRAPHDVGADEWNAARWTLGGLGQAGPIAWLAVAANGTVTDSGNAWNGAPCTVNKTGTGVYVISSPGSVTDNRGEAVSVQFAGAMVSAGRTSAAARVADWELTDVDEVTVRTYNASFAAADAIFMVALY